ncbi:transposase [Alkalihalobacillus sp. LMS39]|uniref:transposase n=1 Tax=Alkalihalobacillus sp. LMS39 TaxID=2924032 RepID=UPI001FB51ABF|nr:transposase [Alkalihalobacillus sp. LMS39]UOE96147.1 transposase [Alkalihalobacillus sp. LMS39]
MGIVIFAAVILIPIIMVIAQRKWMLMRMVFTGAAIVASMTFGYIAATSVYAILENQEVFMTSIHAVFLNSFFLVSGAYLGLYGIYLLCLHFAYDRKS